MHSMSLSVPTDPLWTVGACRRTTRVGTLQQAHAHSCVYVYIYL